MVDVLPGSSICVSGFAAPVVNCGMRAGAQFAIVKFTQLESAEGL